MDMDRRQFLKYLASMFVISLWPLGLTGWAGGLDDSILSTSPQLKRKKFIVLFQRGAVDGLSVVVPYGDGRYYDARPTIALPSSGSSDGVLDLNGYFGLHPALASVFPLWQNKTLGFVHACGSPDPTRSHFDAQNFMECGTPGNPSTPDGWMNRLLSVLPGTHAPTQAVSLGAVLPRIFQGKMNVSNIALGKNTAQPMPIDRPMVESAFNELYKGDDPLSQAYLQGQNARKQLMSDLQQHMEMASQGAPSPSGFTDSARRLAQLINEDANIQLVFLDLGGWDTHVNQGAMKGQLANHLSGLGDGLAALVNGLGPAYNDTVILVMSEFGRTIHENGDGGTDHGHGNAMWVMGGGIKGGVIQGQWPGLDTENLYEERDLAVTTDFRSVIGSVLQQHMLLNDEQLGIVFPDIPQALSSLKFL
jgi:uncharacterized protein (DUF1501 family)